MYAAALLLFFNIANMSRAMASKIYTTGVCVVILALWTLICDVVGNI